MKKYYLLLLFVSSFVNAQIVNIPDAVFKQTLLSTNSSVPIAKDLNGNSFSVDANNDGEVQVLEAQQVSYLRLYDLSINDLTGIEAFTNLTELHCSKLNLSTLNISTLISLKLLNCSENQLNNLDISEQVALETLTCSFNNFTALDFTTNLNLMKISCSSNNLSTLNLSNLSALSQVSCNNNILTSIFFPTNSNIIGLDCSANQLTNLDLLNLNNLTYIDCFDNDFTSLEFENFPNLIQIICGNSELANLNFDNLPNLLILYVSFGTFSEIDLSGLSSITTLHLDYSTNVTSFDFSSLINLNILTCTHHDSLTFFDISQNPNLFNVNIRNNPLLSNVNFKNGTIQDFPSMFYESFLPSLQFICCDDSERDALQFQIDAFYSSLNVSINSYCSFTPGGDYNTITGSMLFDSNNNGCDASDLPQPNIKININDGTNQGATFTNTSGNYSFFTQSGSFTLTPDVENPSWFNFSPTSATIPFADNNDNLITQNFCLSANGIHPDVEVVIVPIIPARPGFDAVYKVVYKNKGNQTVGGYVNFTFDDTVLDFVFSSIVPTITIGSTMNWTISNLAPFQSGSILVTFNVNSPQETPAVNIDDILVFNATINLPSDDNLADNNFDLNQIVVGSYDPNDITCLQGNILPTADIGEYLHYNIRFENTGTYAAENIVVKNEIDLTQYNIQSLQVMESSHPVTVRVTGNIAEFIFQGIDLDTGGHGNILLKLKSNTTLSNDLVINSADIFFDYNFPIITNDEQTVFADLSKNDFVKDASIQVYPNPANDILNVKADNTINSIQLYDAQGRLLLTKMANENTQVLDLSSYSSGIYFINISTSVGKQTQKIIKN